MVHGKNRIPYWIDRRLNSLAGSEYQGTISFGLPIEPEVFPIWGIPDYLYGRVARIQGPRSAIPRHVC